MEITKNNNTTRSATSYFLPIHFIWSDWAHSKSRVIQNIFTQGPQT